MLTQEQIELMPSYERYWKVSDWEAQAQARRELSGLALTPSHMLPFFSISDYEKARRGEPVPIEQPRHTFIDFKQSTDKRSLSEYLREPASPPAPPVPQLSSEVSSTLEYIQRFDDTISMYLRAVGDP